MISKNDLIIYSGLPCMDGIYGLPYCMVNKRRYKTVIIHLAKQLGISPDEWENTKDPYLLIKRKLCS